MSEATQPAAPANTGAASLSSLRDKLGRTYAELVAAGKKILPKLGKHGRFMPRSPGRPKKMQSNPLGPDSKATAAATEANQRPIETRPHPLENTPGTNEYDDKHENPAPPPPSANIPPNAIPLPPQQEIPGLDELKKALADTPADSPEETAGGSPSVIRDEYTRAAAGVVGSLSTVAILAMGAHVKPDKEQTAAMVEAYAASFRHYGYKPETPPWLGPVIATAVWIGPHFADERSQTNLQKWKTKLVNAWLWIRGKVDGRAAAKAAREAGQ